MDGQDGQDKLKSGKEVRLEEVSFRKMRLEEKQSYEKTREEGGMERGCIEYYGIWEAKIKEVIRLFEV